jgi:hypothetical protein
VLFAGFVTTEVWLVLTPYFQDALAPGVRTAVNGFLQGLLNIVSVGGTAQLGLIKFDTGAAVEFPMAPITSNYVTTLVNWVNTIYLSTCCKGNTNWAAALQLAATTVWANPVDIFIMYTDGKPESVVFTPGCADNCMSASNGFFSDLCAPAGSCVGQPTSGLQFSQTFNYQPQGLWASCPQVHMRAVSLLFYCCVTLFSYIKFLLLFEIMTKKILSLCPC